MTPFGRSEGGRPASAAQPHLEIADEWDDLGRPWSAVAWIYVEGDLVTVELDVDAAMLPARVLHACLRSLPRLLQHIANHPDAPVRSADPLLGPDIVRAAPVLPRVGGSWANVEELDHIVAGAPGVDTVRCTVEDGQVVARITGEGAADLLSVHEHVLASLQDHLDVTAPDRYHLADGRRIDLPHRWRSLAPSTAAEWELCAALQETHGLDAIDLSASYLVVGGQLLRSPAVVEVLARRGWGGLSSRHFTAPYTLRSVARALRRAPVTADDSPVYLP